MRLQLIIIVEDFFLKQQRRNAISQICLFFLSSCFARNISRLIVIQTFFQFIIYLIEYSISVNNIALYLNSSRNNIFLVDFRIVVLFIYKIAYKYCN